MYGSDRKKILILLILEILRRKSDADHHLTQQKILRILNKTYGITCDRRSVKANVMDLVEMGYDINMDDDGYYFANLDFEPAELRMLIDSVLFSRHISLTQGKRLIEKLKAQGNEYFQPKVSHVSALPDLSHADNNHIMLVIDTLNDAIAEKKRVEFTYNSYGTDFKLHPRQHSPYLVSPYQMVASNGRYYLLANSDRHPDLTHFRIDRITDIRMTDIPVKPIKETIGMEKGFNLPRHMAEHTYMFCGESVRIQLKTTKSMMNDLIDWFGKYFIIIKEKDDDIIIEVTCNYNAMFYWALQYGSYVEVLSPKKLREELKNTICKMYERYTVTKS